MPEVFENTKLARLVVRRNILTSELRGSSIDDHIHDAHIQADLQDLCAEIALRQCPREAKGQRCYNCRPFLVSLRSKVATHFATFQARPKEKQ